MRNTVMVLVTVFILILIGCTSKGEHKYKLSGESNTWIVTLDINTDKEGTVEYIGILKKNRDINLKSLHYEAEIRTSSPAGNVKGMDLERIQKNQEFTLFTDYPGDPTFNLNDTTEEEVKNLFSNITVQLKWTDDEGEHTEIILLQNFKKE